MSTLIEFFISPANKNRVQYKTDDIPLDNYIRSQFTCPNPAKRHSSGFHISDSLCAITALGSCLPGIAISIIDMLNREYNDLTITITPQVKRLLYPTPLDITNIVQPLNTKYILKDHQYSAVELALTHGRGVMVLATSAGKSLIISSIIQNRQILDGDKQVLIIVPNISLVQQFHDDLIDYGFNKDDITMFTASVKFKKFNRIIVANTQYLNTNASRLPQIDLVILDEAHSCKHDSGVSKLMNSLKTTIKLGFTGSINEELHDKWNVIGHTGPILCDVKAYELQDKEIIAQTDIISFTLDHGVTQPEKTRNEVLQECYDAKLKPYEITEELINLEIAKSRFPMEISLIEKNVKFEMFLTKLTNSQKGNTVILYDHTAHGKRIYNSCMNNCPNKQVFYIDGSIDIETREIIKKKLETNNNCILVGNTKCIGTGISIKAINTIIFAFCAGTASTKILQAVGRGLRLNHNKNKMLLIDINHNFKYSIRHFEERMNLYKENYNINDFRQINVKL